MAVSADIRAKVAEQYPALLPLLKIPEVANLLMQAVGDEPISPTSFQYKLMATRWFRSLTEQQRQDFVESQTDPATMRAKRRSYRLGLSLAATNYGAVLNTAQLNWLTVKGMGQGWESGGPEMLDEVARLLRSGAVKAGPGARRTGARTVQQMARGDYFYQMSNASAAIWGDRIARGLATPEDVRAVIADRALKLYPQFATGLSQGQTMREMTDGHRQIIAEELELDPERIDLSKGRWSKVLGVRDAKGQIRPMTNLEVTQLARQDERWWKTSHGKQTDAEWSRNLMRMFGHRPGLGAS